MQNAPLGAFCNTFDLQKAIIGLKKQFWYSFEWPLKAGFTVFKTLFPTVLTLQLSHT